MSNYTKSTNFATKDNLTPGDPLKIVRGTEIDTEFNNIATAIATKTDNASAALTGGTINDTTIGATTASTGAFTTISATGAITSTLATGTAPLVVASTTKVTNLNVDSLDGADWASPAALGSTTPAAVSATTLSASGNVTLSGGTANGVAYLNGSKVVTSGSALVFDGSNLGLGVTPSAWATSYKAFQIGASSALYAHGAVASVHVTNNSYEDSGGVKYKITGAAADYQQSGGVHYWYNAPSGTAGNAITFTQAMTLDSSGDFLVGSTSSTGERVQFLGTAGAGTMKVQVGADGNNGIGFRNASGTTVGSITVNTSSTAYNTSSDYRLKNTIEPMTGALAKVALLKPCTYKWNADGSDGEGFIAHELAEVVPQCVTGEKDAVNEDGNPQYQGIDTSFLVATLTAALQEAHGLIKNLETRISALEAK
jgi:hypothetical protein